MGAKGAEAKTAPWAGKAAAGLAELLIALSRIVKRTGDGLAL